MNPRAISSAAMARKRSPSPIRARRSAGGSMKTYAYKTVGNLQIQADVYRAEDDVLRPVVVWIHGGALIMGHRGGISDRVKHMILGEGYALVSTDYRLAPETKLPAIIDDVVAGVTWVRS